MRSSGLSFRTALTVPHYGSFAYDMLERDADELPEAYMELCTEIEDQTYPSGLALQRHRLLGHSANIQKDMQLDSVDDFTMWGDAGMLYF